MSEPLFHELLLAGFGGQGVVLAGKLLAAAALAEGREVVWAPSYGPEMRGGPVSCTVILSSGRIGSPEITRLDSLLVMDAASLPKYLARLRPNGLLLVNTSLVAAPVKPCQCELVEIALNDEAEALGDLRVANAIMLGAYLTRRPVVSPDSIIAAMRESAGKAFQHLVDINVRALERGVELAGA